MDDDGLRRIEAKLRRLGKVPEHVRTEVDSAMSSGITGQIGPPVPLTIVEEVERRLGATLPTEYRRYVTEIGDGPMGPGYSMRTLADSFTQPPSYLNDVGRRTVDEGDLSDAEPHVPETLRSQVTVGVQLFGLSDYGCGIEAVLVLSGPHRGDVWVDDPNAGSILPWGLHDSFMHSAFHQARDLPVEERFSFVRWFESWLDGVLRAAKLVEGAEPRDHEGID